MEDSRILKGIYSQQGFANEIGKDKSTVSLYCKDGLLTTVMTEDGKRLIRADQETIEKFRKKSQNWDSI